MAVKDFFLSHASPDKEDYVRPLAEALCQARLTCWLDEGEIGPGDNVFRRINEGLRDARVVVVCLSSATVGRGWAEAEMSAVFEMGMAERGPQVVWLILYDKDRVLEEYPIIRGVHYLCWEEGDDVTHLVQKLRVAVSRAAPAGPPSDEAEATPDTQVTPVADAVDEILEAARPEAPAVGADIVRKVMEQRRDTQVAVLQELVSRFDIGDEDLRWTVCSLIEEFVKWNPRLIDVAFLERMAQDESFSIRSSAAVCYYELAHCAPADVPLDVLQRLADAHEDWYVSSPAIAALQRLTHVRDEALRILERWAASEDDSVREHAAAALRNIANVHPRLLDKGRLQRLTNDQCEAVRDYAVQALEVIARGGDPDQHDYWAFGG